MGKILKNFVASDIIFVLFGFILSIAFVWLFKVLEAADPLIFVVLCPTAAFMTDLFGMLFIAKFTKKEARPIHLLATALGCIIAMVAVAISFL